MESLRDLNEKVFLTTIKIQEEFPELTKYLDELPEHFTYTSPMEVSRKDLKDYLDSLNQLLETFAKNTK